MALTEEQRLKRNAYMREYKKTPRAREYYKKWRLSPDSK